MVARLKLKGIDGRAHTGVEPPEGALFQVAWPMRKDVNRRFAIPAEDFF